MITCRPTGRAARCSSASTIRTSSADSTFGSMMRIGRARMLDDREQVLEAERRAHAVDPHHPLDAVRARAVEQRHGPRPRLVLVRRDHGVLEIDRDHVRAGSERLREPVRPRARHEQQIAARLDRLGHRIACCARYGCLRLPFARKPGDPSRPVMAARVSATCRAARRRHRSAAAPGAPPPGRPRHRRREPGDRTVAAAHRE